jgi:hypothetical protein
MLSLVFLASGIVYSIFEKIIPLSELFQSTEYYLSFLDYFLVDAFMLIIFIILSLPVVLKLLSTDLAVNKYD